jgi:ATP-dependent Clp protease ATP-binding subunit ClpC
VFERFTDRARKVMVLAQEEARLMDHGFIGTEHLLLGLLNEGEGIGARALERLGVTLQSARADIEQRVTRSAAVAGEPPPFTPRAKKVLELSLREALQLGHNYIGTEHILLGIVREGEGVGSEVLVALGADLSSVRQQVVQLLSGFVHGPQPLPPLCPHCAASLEEHATASWLTVKGDGGIEAPFLVLSCGQCGKALAFKPEA